MQAVFLTFGLHRQLTYTLRTALWLGLWFIVTIRPRHWAVQADGWNDNAGKPIWEATFLRVHALVWRLLLTFLLYTIVGLMSATAGKMLSLQFHHKNHFECMQVRRSHAVSTLHAESMRLFAVVCSRRASSRSSRMRTHRLQCGTCACRTRLCTSTSSRCCRSRTA